MMAGAYGLRDETARKLSNYIRCVFLGSLAATIDVRGGQARKTMEAGDQVNQYVGYKRGDEVEAAVTEAAKVSAFLPLDDGGEVKKEFRDLIHKIRSERRAPLPSQCVVGGRNFFDAEELKDLKPLYPLGL
jgi:hypothetical protein